MGGPRPAPRHVERTGAFTLPLAVADAFPLFSPEGERIWADGWDPEYLHPSHPSVAAGTVFRTAVGGEETLWLVLDYDADAGVVSYGRFVPGSRIGTVRVKCRALDATHTHVTVTYALTAVSAAGTALLADFSPARYDTMLAQWRDAIVQARAPHGYGPGVAGD